MKTSLTNRGFRVIFHEKYAEPPEYSRLIQESSRMGNYENSDENPGSSFLWIGKEHHLDREEVKEMISKLQYWLDNKRLPFDKEIPCHSQPNNKLL